MERSVTVTQAARNFSDLVNRAFYRGESTLLLRSGQAVARVIPIAPLTRSGKDLATIWPKLPHLTKEEATNFDLDIRNSKKILKKPQIKWD